MTDWQEVHLADVVSVKHGYAFPGDQFSSEFVKPRLVTPGNFKIGGGFKEVDPPKTFDGHYPEEFILPAGSVVVTMTDLSKNSDTLGLPARIPKTHTYLHNQRVGRINVCQPSVVTAEFLHYYLRTTRYRQHIIGTASGSTVRHTSPSRIGSFLARLPPISEQYAIVEVLGAVDDKIDANDATTAAAHDLAASYFTGIPIQYTDEVRLGEVLSLEYGRALPSDRRSHGTVSVVGSGGVVGSHDTTWLNAPGVVVGRKGTVGATYWLESPYFPIDTTYYVRPQGPSIPLIFCYHLLRTIDFSILNSDSAVPGLNRSEAYSIPVRLPHRNQLEIASQRSSDLFRLAKSLRSETSNLAALRDTLLPHLMSGRLRVRDAEKQVEAVV